jgi:peptide-methionine (S)-S-oxide reductase
MIVRRKTAFLAAFFFLSASQAQGEPVAGTEKAVFAAGCFWGVEKVFSALKGVSSTQVGYTGGTAPNPTYEQVCTGRTGHAEAIEISFDPSVISYEELLEVFFRHHNPTTLNRQGNDVGSQYRSAIFYHSSQQKKAAETALAALDKAKLFRDGIVTEVSPASDFYRAEEYHQKYLKKNPLGYCNLQMQSAKVGEVLKAARAKN